MGKKVGGYTFACRTTGGHTPDAHFFRLWPAVFLCLRRLRECLYYVMNVLYNAIVA